MHCMEHLRLIAPYFLGINFWVDETGADARGHIRRYGYAIRGIRPMTHRFVKRGTRVNGFSQDGTSSGSVNGITFFDFVRGTVITVTMPFDGVNPRSILMMENCTIYHVNKMEARLRQACVVVHFLPPYSLQLKKLSAMLRVISRNMTNRYKQEPRYSKQHLIP